MVDILFNITVPTEHVSVFGLNIRYLLQTIPQ